MKTSSKARYSLHLIIDITQHQHKGPVSLREVSLRQNLSLKYLEQLATILARDKYIKSVRGAQGGYQLARPADQITAGDIMRAAEGGFVPVDCLDSDEPCPRQGLCGTATFWAGLRKVVDTYVDSVTIAQLAQGIVPLDPLLPDAPQDTASQAEPLGTTSAQPELHEGSTQISPCASTNPSSHQP